MPKDVCMVSCGNGRAKNGSEQFVLMNTPEAEQNGKKVTGVVFLLLPVFFFLFCLPFFLKGGRGAKGGGGYDFY